MANWLDKFNPRPPETKKSRNLPMQPRGSQVPYAKVPLKQLPNASIVYGMASAVLYVVAVYFMLFRHMWFGGFLVILPATCLLGFALYFLKYSR